MATVMGCEPDQADAAAPLTIAALAVRATATASGGSADLFGATTPIASQSKAFLKDFA